VKRLGCAHCSMPAVARCDFTIPVLGAGVPMDQWPKCNAPTCPRHTWRVLAETGVRTYCPLHKLKQGG
jgi:hypothetical protein